MLPRSLRAALLRTPHRGVHSLGRRRKSWCIPRSAPACSLLFSPLFSPLTLRFGHTIWECLAALGPDIERGEGGKGSKANHFEKDKLSLR